MTKTSLFAWIKIILELGKVRISLPIALSALVGYTLKTGALDRQYLVLTTRSVSDVVQFRGNQSHSRVQNRCLNAANQKQANSIR